MKVSSRGCHKKFSTNFTRNKHERANGNGPKKQKVKKPICYDSFNNLHLCPTENFEQTGADMLINFMKTVIIQHVKKLLT